VDEAPRSLESLNPRWWEVAWWEDPSYAAESRLSLDEIRGAIAATRSLFDEAWTQKALKGPLPNAVLAVLFGGQGLTPFSHLMWLGRIALAVAKTPGVVRRLEELGGQKARATLFELEVASWFIEEGWQVEFLKPTNNSKTPDMQVRKGEILSWVECKRFEPEQWEDWATDLTNEIILRIHRHGPQLPSFDVLFEPRLADLNWQDPQIRRAVLEEVADRIIAAATTAFSTTPPASVSIPGVAVIRVREDHNGTQRGIGGIQVSSQAKMRRIAQKGVLEAAQQLDSHGFGAVVVWSDFTPPQELVETVLAGLNRAEQGLLKNVGVVAIPGSLGAGPVVWRNPQTLMNPAGDALAASLASALLKLDERLLPAAAT
jgi:hypothetical protein